MNKTRQEKEEHNEKMLAILNQMRAEMSNWFGWRDAPEIGMARIVALGECILELTDSDRPHDSWLMDARNSYIAWKQKHGVTPQPEPAYARDRSAE